MVWRGKLVFVLLGYNLTSYQLLFITKYNSTNKFYWIEFVPWGINLTYWNKFTKPNLQYWVHQAKCVICEEPNIPKQIHLIKPTKLNPSNQFYQTKSSLMIFINFMPQILNEVKQSSSSSLSWAWPSTVPAYSAILLLHGSHRSYPSRRRACFLLIWFKR